MKKFAIKSSLAMGLAHRLSTLDAQVVADALGNKDVINAIRTNLKVADAINAANKAFFDAVTETENKKRAVLAELQAEYKANEEGKTPEEKSALGRELTAKFNAKAAELDKESSAKPDEIIEVTLSDEQYSEFLLPVFKKTAQLWDVQGNGNGQKLFIEVADALEAVSDV